eukprot:961657-Prymnesium_polylepis.1
MSASYLAQRPSGSVHAGAKAIACKMRPPPVKNGGAHWHKEAAVRREAAVRVAARRVYVDVPHARSQQHGEQRGDAGAERVASDDEAVAGPLLQRGVQPRL